MNIIITGAGKGIGFALTQAFLKETGHKVLAISRNIESLTDLSQHGSGNAMSLSELIPYRFDLVHGDFEELKGFVDLHFEQIDLIVNNAGYMVSKPFSELSGDDYEAIFSTNIKSVFLTVQAMLPRMKRGSHIVNISSMGGFQGSAKFSGLSLYSASKGALSILTECMAEEFKDKGVYVNALALGAVQTEMLSAAFPGYKAPLLPAQMAEYIKDFALKGHKVFNGKILPVSLSTP